MSHQLWTAAVICGWAFTGGSAFGQHVEEDRGHSTQTGASVVPAGDPDVPAAVKKIVEQTNDFRKTEGRPAVTVDDKLAATARDFAAYMAENDKFSHTADGSRPADRVSKHGYEYSLVAENIAYIFGPAGFTTAAMADKFVTGWEKSPGHRKNMLDPDVTQTGVGIARSGKTGYYYAVQLFGRPKSAAVEFAVTNDADAAFEYTVAGESFTLDPRYTRTHTGGRPPEVAFKWPGAKDPEPAVKPANGDKFAVTKGPDGWAVKKN